MNELVKFDDNNNICQFKFNNKEVRILYDINNEPWFVGKDVALIL